MQNLDFIDHLNTNEQDTITEEKEELINGLKNSNQKKLTQSISMIRKVQFFLKK